MQWNHYDGGIELVTRGHCDLWQNNLSSARAHFEALIEQRGPDSPYVALARMFHCIATAATGNAQLIVQATSNVREILNEEVHGVPWPVYRRISAAALAAASSEYQRAMNILAPLQQEASVPVVMTVSADIYRRAGRPELALESLARIEHPERISYVAVSALVTTAAISRQRGSYQRAHVSLERALDIAVTESVILPFIPALGDDVLRELIAEHAAWGTAHESFLATHVIGTLSGAAHNQVLGYALSRREREILGFLRTTMTAEEIAAALHVSVNTVRTHQRAIYRKLGVSTRRDAVKFRI